MGRKRTSDEEVMLHWKEAEKWSGVRTPNLAFERQGKMAKHPLWPFERQDLAFERQPKMKAESFKGSGRSNARLGRSNARPEKA